MGSGPAPLFTFGVIADVQYADIDDGFNFTGTRRRFYRGSLGLLRSACRAWRSAPLRPRFVLQLGDLIDGFNRPHAAGRPALDAALRELSAAAAPVHHVWGNHEFYNFSRRALMESPLNSTPPAPHGDGGGGDRGCDGGGGDFYAYHFSPAPRFRFVVLDAYDFNGAFSRDQLAWLDEVLTRSDLDQEVVVLLSHLPVHPLATEPICLAWNSEEVLTLLEAHSCVVCFMAGHDHDGGYHRDRRSGVHHLTLEGVVETPPESHAFATVSVYQDRMLLEGRGRTAHRELLFARPPDDSLAA
ncbi:hypothetical protein NHX12_025510 [Muraenolepis orangiensis]|uniref:Manganese-dependent ADP-ribose/CDP-alcohol diphosphatase n=1 Tax=Muraenolepis orangiensis TaxID=630683 RepID=A0A9Q0EMV6_9TELE|nr:hypothetical protein NHX12_025510 [Muraenolepis orangiensis]